MKNSLPMMKKRITPVRMSPKDWFRLKRVAISPAPRERKTSRKLVRIIQTGLNFASHETMTAVKPRPAVIVVVSVPVTCLFSLWVASLIYKMRSFSTSFFRCVFYLPVVTGSVAVTVVWKWIFNNYYGVLNYLCRSLGLISRNINWLGNAQYALACIITILLTTSVGQPIVLYVSALSNVDHSLIEAASVDGATNTQVFWKIKWPQIMPTTLYILVITTINSFQCFALIQLLTSGGPNNSTQTIMYYIYYNAFKLSRYGYGSAMGIILAVIIALFSALQFKLAKTDNG